jgi:hypothetical protein
VELAMTTQEKAKSRRRFRGVRLLPLVAVNACLPDKVGVHRGGAHHRIADGKKECNFVWHAVDRL